MLAKCCPFQWQIVIRASAHNLSSLLLAVNNSLSLSLYLFFICMMIDI